MLHHELVHYKRHDIWYKWLFQAALCVHWFNPLVYIFNRKFHIDCELACDETVLKLLSEEGRRAYGNVLLDVAQKNWFEGAFSGKGMGMYRNMPTMTLLEEKSTLKERLRGIARYHKTDWQSGSVRRWCWFCFWDWRSSAARQVSVVVRGKLFLCAIMETLR